VLGAPALARPIVSRKLKRCGLKLEVESGSAPRLSTVKERGEECRYLSSTLWHIAIVGTFDSPVYTPYCSGIYQRRE